MARYYEQIGDAIGDAMAHNARMAAQIVAARAAEDAARLVPCGSTPDNPRCTVSVHAICEKHH